MKIIYNEPKGTQRFYLSQLVKGINPQKKESNLVQILPKN